MIPKFCRAEKALSNKYKHFDKQRTNHLNKTLRKKNERTYSSTQYIHFNFRTLVLGDAIKAYFSVREQKQT